MALEAGNINASSGMSKNIFEKIDLVLSPPLEGIPPEDFEKIRDSWRKLAFAIAQGVIEHLTANMEIYGIQTLGNINTTITGDVEEALPAPNPNTHDHSFNLSGEENNVVFNQSNDGTGHVR